MIEGAIEQWHEGDSDIPLHEFLKMSWDEYKEYVEKMKSQKTIMGGLKSGNNRT